MAPNGDFFRRLFDQQTARPSLFSDVERLASDADTRLSDVLRKCVVLAHRLQHQPFKDWVNYELNGYPKGVELPEYRKVRSIPYGSFTNGFYHYKTTQIPLQWIPEAIRDQVSEVRFFHSVAQLEGYSKSDEPCIKFAWVAELMWVVRHEISRQHGEDVGLLEAYLPIPVPSVAEILDTIRNRILTFTLELGDAIPDIEEKGGQGSRALDEKVGTYFLNFVIHGNTNIGKGNTMSNESYNVNNTVGPVNIKSRLENVSQTINNAGSLDGNTRTEFKQAFDRLTEALQPAESKLPDDSAQIAALAETLARELAREKPRRSMLDVTLTGLKEAAEAVSAIAPAVVGCVARIALLVAGLPTF